MGVDAAGTRTRAWDLGAEPRRPAGVMSRPHQRENAMKMSLRAALCTAALMFAVGTASADSWKDESGKGRWRGDYGWGDSERKFKYRTADGCEVERKWKSLSPVRSDERHLSG